MMTENVTSNLTAYVNGISLIGPGLINWPDTVPILAEKHPYEAQATVLPAPMLLPAAERRRSGELVKLTLAVGLEAIESAGEDATKLACVYTSSSGDGKNCHEICKTLASDDRQISPTRFHNSVHNAAAGYWSIATGARTPISVLCAHDASFGAGLLEAVIQVTTDGISTILMACDTAYPEPLNHVRPIPDALGVGMVLSPIKNQHSMVKIKIHLTDAPANQLSNPELELLRTKIPAARCLPLLVAIAQCKATTVTLDYLKHQRLSVEVTPCL
jgi:hypothetical protein